MKGDHTLDASSSARDSLDPAFASRDAPSTGSIAGAVTLDPAGGVAEYGKNLAWRRLSYDRESVPDLLAKVSRAHFSAQVVCDDPRLLIGLPCPHRVDRGNHIDGLRWEAELALKRYTAGLDDRFLNIYHRWAATLLAWAYATADAAQHTQGWLLVDACMRLQRSRGGPEARWVQGMVRRYGLDGQTPATRREVADEIGVGTERVRQVENKLHHILGRHEYWIPALTRPWTAPMPRMRRRGSS